MFEVKKLSDCTRDKLSWLFAKFLPSCPWQPFEPPGAHPGLADDPDVVFGVSQNAEASWNNFVN